MKKKIFGACKYFLYSAIFWAYAAAHLYVMYQNKRIAFNGTDGQMQYFPAMRYIRQLVIDFLANHSFPFIEWTLAMGEDTIATLNYYGLGNPLYIFSALVRKDLLPYFFNFLLYLQIYLGGIAFIAFAQSHKKDKSPFAYAVGALLYSFSGFTYQCELYYNFAHAMIFIPLMLLGTQRSIVGKKKGVLGASVFFFALCGFFYLYIGSLSIAVYTIYILAQNKTALKNAIYIIKNLVLEYAAGLCLSAFIFIPSVLGYLQCNRIPNVKINLFASFSEIKEFFVNVLYPPYSNLNQVMSVSTIGVFMILWILSAKGVFNEKRNIILMFFLCLCPPASAIMTGGGVYNRWHIVFILYIAYLMVKFWDKIPTLSLSSKIGSIIMMDFLVVYGKRMSILDHERFRITIFGSIIIVGLTVSILPFFQKIKKEKLGMFILFIAVVMINIRGWHVMASDMTLNEIDEGDIVSELSDNMEGNFYRIDYQRTAQAPYTAMNAGFSQGYHGVSGYFSILNSSYTRALREWNVNETDDYHTYGLRSRMALESLCAVKYLILANDPDWQVPYGCVPVQNTADNAWVLYENQCALPIVYTYRNVFDENAYSNMTGFEKQQVMLQAAAIEDYYGTLETTIDYDNQLKNIPYTITEIDKAILSDGMITVQDGGTIKLSAQLHNNCENYLVTRSGNCKFNVFVEDAPSSHSIIVTQYDNGMTGADLGQVYWNNPTNITISFTEDTVINIQDLALCYYDFTGYKDYIAQRKEGVIDTQVSANTIMSKLNLNEDNIVCIAVPYSKGWNAQIDGKPTKIYKTNDMFMGVEVSKGTHLLKLDYCTEGLKCGALISLFTLLLIILVFIKHRRSINHK